MKNVKRKVKRYQVPGKERENLVLNLMLLMKASVPVGEAFETITETTTSSVMRKALKQMTQDVDEGIPLWKTLDRAGVVTAQTIALTRIGEESGTLVANLRVAGDQEEKQRIFQSKVRSALLYPTFVLGITGVVGLGVSWFLLPKLAQTFSQLNVELPTISKIFIGFGAFLKADGVWAVPLFIIGLMVIGYILFGAEKTKGSGQRLLLHLPGIGKLVRDLETARFGYLLGILLDSGLSVGQVWRLLASATISPRYRALYQYLESQFENGYNFKASFADRKRAKGLIPVAVQQMVIAAERSGNLPETLREIGKMYEERADIDTQNLEATLEPILLLFIAGAVLAVAIAIIMPIYGLLGGLQQ